MWVCDRHRLLFECWDKLSEQLWELDCFQIDCIGWSPGESELWSCFQGGRGTSGDFNHLSILPEWNHRRCYPLCQKSQPECLRGRHIADEIQKHGNHCGLPVTEAKIVFRNIAKISGKSGTINESSGQHNRLPLAFRNIFSSFTPMGW
jgi:hypothetical protein